MKVFRSFSIVTATLIAFSWSAGAAGTTDSGSEPEPHTYDIVGYWIGDYPTRFEMGSVAVFYADDGSYKRVFRVSCG